MSLRLQYALLRALGPDPYESENKLAEAGVQQQWMRERREARKARQVGVD